MNQKIIKLFTYKEIDLLLNLDELLVLNGKREEVAALEKSLGRFLLVTSIITLLGCFFLLFLQGKFTLVSLLNPNTIALLVPYLIIAPIILGLYLSRNREDSFKINKNFNLNNAFSLRLNENRPKQLLVNDFIDYETTLLLNKISDHKKNFIYYLANEILNDSRFINLLVRRLGLNVKDLIVSFELNINSKLNFDEDYINFFSRLLNETLQLKDKQINKHSLFFVLLKYYLHDLLIDKKVSDIELEGLKSWYVNSKQKLDYEKSWKRLAKLKPLGDVNASYTSSITPTLDIFSDDLTGKLLNREFITSIGRDKEMLKLLTQLEGETNSFTYLIGENGVGKKRLVKNLATRMIVEDVPTNLRESRLISINFSELVSEAKSIDDLKVNLIKIFNEIERSGNIVLIADNFTSLFSFRSNVKAEAINLLKSLLENKVKLIAIDSTYNYSKFIKSDIELASRFNVIEFSEVEPQIALQILADESVIKERKHKIDIYFSALKKIVDYSYKFDYEKRMPQKGIDLLEESILLAKSKGLNYLDFSIVDEILFSKIGVQIGNLDKGDKDKLLELEDQLKSRVIGQNEAVNAVVSAIKRSRLGLINKKKPIASFLFYGPTGVGKTELAKSLADLYYGSENMMVRLDMSEYQEEENLTRIIGRYNIDGTFTRGFLADSVRSKPFSLILLDEIEKANPKVLDLFLSVLDDGYFKDGMDRKVIFENTIIIMTSNVGSREIQLAYSQKKSLNEIKNISIEILSQYYRPEFLNRFDKLIMFKHLSLLEVTNIVDNFMVSVNQKLVDRNIEIKWNAKTLEELARLGYSPVWGARELRRIIQERIEDLLADQIISGNIKDGDQIFLDGLTINKII